MNMILLNKSEETVVDKAFSEIRASKLLSYAKRINDLIEGKHVVFIEQKPHVAIRVRNEGGKLCIRRIFDHIEGRNNYSREMTNAEKACFAGMGGVSIEVE